MSSSVYNLSDINRTGTIKKEKLDDQGKPSDKICLQFLWQGIRMHLASNQSITMQVTMVTFHT